jgi:hypothetical protein
MKKPAEKKATMTASAAAAIESLAASGLETYIRGDDGAVMVEIAPHSFLNAEHLRLASGRPRAT